MSTRITIQDIANELKLSRNTVSKAINNTGTIADSTREMILQKAAEMGYKQFSYIDINAKKIKSNNDNINRMELAFVTTTKLDTSHFGSTMIDKIQQELSEIGCSLSIYRVMPNEIQDCRLPGSLDITRISGIFCAEVFNIPYCRMLSELSIPVLFIDSPCMMEYDPLNADVLLMDNDSYAYKLVKELKDKNIDKIGFVGDKYHCRSFYERYSAFRKALDFWQIDFNEEFCLTATEGDNWDEHYVNYSDYLMSGLKKMPALPDIFICANDFVAIDMLKCFRNLKISVPDDVMLCGFDDSQESTIVMPPLTTVHIHSQAMGHEAVELLISRIKQPSLNYRIVHTETNLIFRESTTINK